MTDAPMTADRAREMLAAEYRAINCLDTADAIVKTDWHILLEAPAHAASLRAIEKALQSADEVPAKSQGHEDDGWRPIETAPRDGEPVLIWTPETHTYVTMGRYWIQDEAWADEEGEQAFPTHWRPLPPAPEMGR